MATPIVGQSIEKPTPPTDVPGGANVSADIGAAPQAQAAPMAQEMPAGFEDISAMEMQEVPEGYVELGNQDIIEDVPEYASGISPEQAINKSPLDIMDRLKLSAGNKVGNLKYLKSKFEDAAISSDGSFKVKKDGAWHNVDASNGMAQDAWAVSRTIAAKVLPPVLGNLFAPDEATQAEALKDIADVAPEIASTALGAAGALGGAVAGPVGSVAGAGAGGAAAGALRTSLGRLAGTYEATPEEQVKDIGWDALLSLGGQTVAIGAKPTIQAVRNALVKTGVGTSTIGKEVLSAAYSQLTGQPRWAFRRAMDDAPAVVDKAAKALAQLKPGASPIEAADIIKSTQNGIVKSLAKESDAALQGQYRRNLGEVMASTPDTFVIKPKEAIESAMIELQEQGFGQVSKEGKNVKFDLLSDDALSRLLQAPKEQLPKILGPQTKQQLQVVADILNQYSKIPSMSGKQGAAKAVELRRALRESFDEISASDAPGQIKNIVAQVKKGIDEKIGQSFADAGNIDQYLKLNKEYSKYADAVKLLKKAVNSRNPQELENLTQKLSSKAGSYRQLKEEAGDLANLLGHDKVQSLVDWEAAKSFLDFVPRAQAGGDLLTTAGRMVLGTTIASPRAAGQTIKYGNKTLDFIRSLGPKQLDNLIKDDQALATVLSLGGQAASQEADDVASLLQQAGITGQENQ